MVGREKDQRRLALMLRFVSAARTLTRPVLEEDLRATVRAILLSSAKGCSSLRSKCTRISSSSKSDCLFIVSSSQQSRARWLNMIVANLSVALSVRQYSVFKDRLPAFAVRDDMMNF